MKGQKKLHVGNQHCEACGPPRPLWPSWFSFQSLSYGFYLSSLQLMDAFRWSRDEKKLLQALP